MPVSLLMFQQASLVSPLANMIMVPYVSFLVVPLVLLGILLLFVSDTASGVLFSIADWLFSLIWPLLQWLSDWPWSHWVKAQPGVVLALLALLGVAILLTPRLRHVRVAGAVLMLPMLLWQPQPPPPGGYRLDVLDVGQGLAVVVTTHSRTLVYDTGARFSERLDSGKAVLLPFLRNQGIERIDLLIISHGDGDHIGGAPSLLEAYPDTRVLGQGIGKLAAASSECCLAGQTWAWDGVSFTMLHPDNAGYASSNNRSCVLRVEGAGGSVLITGDIEKKVENSLLQRYRDELAADVLVAPHHGSKTSSMRNFVEAVSAHIVIFAAGYRNRYHFPNRAVVARYAATDASMYVSGRDGAISLAVHPHHGISKVESYREAGGKYWNHRVPGFRQAD